MFERFAEDAQRVVQQARAEATELRHGHIGTEHLLLGLMGSPDTAAYEALVVAGASPASVREKVTEALASRTGGTASLPGRALSFSDRANRALDRAGRLSLRLGRNEVHAEHILLSLLTVEGTAGQVLRGLSVDPDAVQHALQSRPGGTQDPQAASGRAATPDGSRDQALLALLDKQSIREVVLRYCRGIDRLDMALVRSCYHDDGVDHHTGFTGGADDYVAWVEKGLRRFAGTMHFVGNCLIEVDGDLARSETYGNAHHWAESPEDPRLNFVTGFRYVDRFERRRGEWRIAERWAVREWTRSIPADTVRPKEGDGPMARRDRGDPIYLL